MFLKRKFNFLKSFRFSIFTIKHPENSSNFKTFLQQTPICPSTYLTPKKLHEIFEKKTLEPLELISFMKQTSCNLENFTDKADILYILRLLKHIKRQKSLPLSYKTITNNYCKEIIQTMNKNLEKEFTTAGFQQYMNPDKGPEFYSCYLRELSIIDRMEFIQFIRKINGLELHNTNTLNKYTVFEFEETFKKKKKRFMNFLPIYLIIGAVVNLFYWIWIFYYRIEYDVWLFNPKVTDYHIYRFS